MSITGLKIILYLEKEILDQDGGMSAEEARNFYRLLYSYEKDVTKSSSYYWALPSGTLGKDCILTKINWMQEKLRRFFEPIDKSTLSTESKVNNSADQTATDSLNSLLKKQKFYIQMIDSLKLEGELSPKKAELQYDHVSQFYEKFVSNQSEIMTFVKDADFEDQVNVSKKIQRKVLSLQETMKEISSPNKPTALPESKVNDNRTERPHVIVDLLDSLRKKQKSFIEKIKTIDSKNNIDPVEAEISYNHLSQLYESFVKNQAKIETYVDGVTLDKELEISGEILEKVMSLQMKLRKIFSPVASISSDVSILVDESDLEKSSKFDKITVLNSLLDKQQSLIKEIDSINSFAGVFIDRDADGNIIPMIEYVEKDYYESSLKKLPELKNSFISNQTEIDELLNDDFDRFAQEKIYHENLAKLVDIQKQLEAFLNFCKVFVV